MLQPPGAANKLSALVTKRPGKRPFNVSKGRKRLDRVVGNAHGSRELPQSQQMEI